MGLQVHRWPRPELLLELGSLSPVLGSGSLPTPHHCGWYLPQGMRRLWVPRLQWRTRQA